MLIEDSLTRSVSSKVSATTKDLYSAFSPLSSELEQQANKVLDEIASTPIYYVDTAGTVEEISSTILDFSAKVSKDDGLVVTLDHALLTKGKQTDLEKVIIDELMRKFVDLKKLFASKGLKIIFVVLSQLNRDIEKPERVQNQFLQFPNRNDIFASSAIYTCSDYVIITHRPAVVTGMRDFYGPPDKGYPKGRPVYSPVHTTKSMVYWHIIKERFGEQQILAFVEDFKNAKLIQA
jgi:replicative DNA helicase